MAKDLYHDAVKEALEKENWEIINDPLRLKISDDLVYMIDLAAEKYIIATKAKKVIVVEIKTFQQGSNTYSFHGALGQYCVYKSALKFLDLPYELFLAVPHNVFKSFFQQPFIQQVLIDYDCKIMTYSPDEKEIIYGKI